MIGADVTSATCSATHCVEVRSAAAYTWAVLASKGNRFGQLGRRSEEKVPHPVEIKSGVPMVKGAVGGSKKSGHTLLLDAKGEVWSFGCDRWQQLGLGSSSAGAVGYTWKGGRLWRHVPERIQALAGVQDIAAGDDHSVALLSGGNVWTWGRGEHGQLGQGGAKPFVMPPTKSIMLSGKDVTGVVAAGNCTAVIGHDGSIVRYAGKCKDLLENFKG